jgi:hypothetical protein
VINLHQAYCQHRNHHCIYSELMHLLVFSNLLVRKSLESDYYCLQ